MSILLFLLSCVDAYCLDATIPLHQHLPRSSPSTSDYESSSAATSNLDSYEDEGPTSAVPSSTEPPTEEPNTPDSSEPSALWRSRNRNIPHFFLFERGTKATVYKCRRCHFGLCEGANLMDKWGYKVVTDGSHPVPFIEDHYTLYNVSFDEFSSAFIVYLPITA